MLFVSNGAIICSTCTSVEICVEHQTASQGRTGSPEGKLCCRAENFGMKDTRSVCSVCIHVEHRKHSGTAARNLAWIVVIDCVSSQLAYTIVYPLCDSIGRQHCERWWQSWLQSSECKTYFDQARVKSNEQYDSWSTGKRVQLNITKCTAQSRGWGGGSHGCGICLRKPDRVMGIRLRLCPSSGC